MTSQDLNNSFYFSMRAKAGNLSAFNVSRRSRIAILVMLGELCERETRRVERSFAAFFYLAQHFLNELASMGAGDGTTPNITPFAELVNVRDAGVRLPTI